MPVYGLPYTDKQLFNLINLVFPAWVLLAVAPRWRYTKIISAAAALFQAALYAAVVVTMMVTGSEDEKFNFEEMGHYEGVAKALAKRSATLPCWVHYIAFDLWVGRWIAADSVERGVPQLLLIPCLFLTLMLGPVGLLTYWLVRAPFNKAAKQKVA